MGKYTTAPATPQPCTETNLPGAVLQDTNNILGEPSPPEFLAGAAQGIQPDSPPFVLDFFEFRATFAHIEAAAELVLKADLDYLEKLQSSPRTPTQAKALDRTKLRCRAFADLLEFCEFMSWVSYQNQLIQYDHQQQREREQTEVIRLLRREKGEFSALAQTWRALYFDLAKKMKNVGNN